MQDDQIENGYDQNEEIDNDFELDQKPVKKSGGIRNVANNFLNKLLGKGKNSKKGSSKMIVKITLKFKIVILCGLVFIIFIVAILIIIGDDASKSAVNTRSDGVQSLGIDENSSDIEKAALELFNQYDSLIGFNDEQLNIIYQNLKDNEKSATKYLIESGSQEFGNSNDKYSLDGKKTLYEHIQRTEKYNFNNIVWKEYSHNSDGNIITTVDREDLGLKIPSNIDDSTLITLFKTTAPYLLTNDIPLGMLCGMVTSATSSSATDPDTSEKLTYEIIKEAQTKLTVDKYVLQSVKKNTVREEYDTVNYSGSFSVIINLDGSVTIVSNPSYEQVGESIPNTPQEVQVGDSITSEDIYWYVSNAQTYDSKIINEFDYTKYNEQDVNNLVNPDSNILTGTTEINRVVGGEKITSSDIPGDLASLILKFGLPDGYDLTTLPRGVQVDYTISYTAQLGTSYNYEKEWKDKCSPKASNNTVFTYDDLKEYNTTENEEYKNIATDKKIYSADDFNAEDPYKRYESEDSTNDLYGLSFIDFMDSNEGIYLKYIASKNAAYSEVVGLGRHKMKEGYRQIKNILNELLSKIKDSNTSITDSNDGNSLKEVLPFVYGSSLGYEVTDISIKSSATSDYVSGMDLLKQYIRSFEGYGEQPIQTNADGVECYVAYRDSGENLTIGYGVNLDGNPTDKIDLEEKIGQTIDVGTLVPVELVDAIEEQKIKSFYDTVKAKTNGLDLKEYQIHALTSLEYNNIKVDKIVDYYKDSAYWNEETDDKYEEVYEKYKDNETAVSQIEAEADMTRGLYTDWLALNIHDNKGNELPGLIRRRRSEYILFSLGYYNTLQKFWNAGGTPGDINLYNADGTVNEGACIELQNWFDQNIFSGHMGLEQTVSWKSRDFSRYDSKWVSYVTHDLFKQTGSQGGSPVGISGFIYQCPWWALSRAHLYLYGKDPEKWKNGLGGGHGHGMEVAQRVANQYYLPCESNWDDLRPNSIISFNTGNGVGHVAYVEAVDKKNGYYYVSHAGSGKHFYGITKHKIGEGAGVNAISMQFVCLEGL